MMFDLIIASFINTLQIVLSLILLPFKVFGYHLSIYTASNYVDFLLINLKEGALILENDNTPRNFSFGRWYVAYIYAVESEHGTKTTVYLFSTRAMSKELIKDHSGVRCENKKDDRIMNITMFYKDAGGSWWGYNWSEFNTKCARLANRYHQMDLADTILEYHTSYDNVMRCTVAFIDGPPKGGKSTIARILASRLEYSIICDDYRPMLAGDMFIPMYRAFQKVNTSTAKRTLILVLDEVDCIIREFERAASVNNKYAVQVTNKSTWNSLLDHITNYCTDIIVLLTSNTNYDEISADKSYLRPGRVHLRYTLTEDNYEQHPM